MAIDKSIRQYYDSKYSAKNRKGFFRGAQADASAGRGAMSPGTSGSGGSRNGGGQDHPDRGWQTYVAPVAPDPVVTTAKAPPSILARPDPVVTTAKAPPSILARDKVVPPSMLGGAEDALWTPPIKDIVNFGDDARAHHLQTLQKKAVINWNNKTEREKEEQQEKWDAAESKVKLQKEGSIWKTLGNVALAMILPALLPAELARGYNLYKTASKASAFAKKIGLTDQDAVQYVKNNLLKGKDLTSLVAGDKNVIATNMAKFSGKGDQADSNEEYTEKIVRAVDVKPTDQITDEQAEYIKRRNIVQGILDQGVYNGTELTAKQRNNLINYIEQISKFIVNPIEMAAHGGRIDKALGGRSRDI